MTRIQKIAAGLVALVAVSGAGAAVAATKLASTQQESRAVVNDAANQLGVTPERLTTALKTALKNRVDAAVKAGQMTKAEGDALKSRIEANEVPFLGPGFRHHGPGNFKREFRFHLSFKLEAAAKYLGMAESTLRSQIEDGKTLAQVARDRDKSVDGLVDELFAESRKRIDQAVKDGQLTREEADDFVIGLRERIGDFVNSRFLRLGPGRGFPRLDDHEFREFQGNEGPMLRPAF